MEVIILAAEWAGRNGTAVLPCDDPNNRTIGYTSASDDDLWIWSVPLYTAYLDGGCSFLRIGMPNSRQIIQMIINTEEGRAKLKRHTQSCGHCAVTAVMRC